MTPCGLLLLLIVNIFGLRGQQLSIVGSYVVKENVTKGHVVDGDIRQKTGLSTHSNIRLGPGSLNSFVSLDKDDGSLKISSDIDMEGPALCRTEPSCCRNTKPGDRYDLMELFQGLSLDQFQPGSFCILQSFILGSIGSSPQPIPIGKLALVIQDINDNAPDFYKDNDMELRKYLPPRTSPKNASLTIRFKEGAYISIPERPLPLAKDSDFSETYRIKRYGLVEPQDDPRNAQSNLGPFRLDYMPEKDQLFLKLMVPLDREMKQEYNLLLVAMDGENLHGEIPLKIIVDDVNEFDPVFVDSYDYGSSFKVISVDENQKVGSELAQVQATDRDAPPGNVVKYRLMGTDIQEQFQVNPENGKITLRRPLDYEVADEYELTIVAVDGGIIETDSIFEQPKGQRSATTTIKIIVNDINDNRPMINLEHSELGGPDQALPPSSPHKMLSHEFGLYENVPHGTPVTYFSVRDHDSGENGQVTCQLQNWSQVFRLNKFSELYSIETIVDIDREAQPSYNLKVNCQDNGKPSQRSEASILVKVLDVNDEKPKFAKDIYRYRVKENSKIGTKLTPASKLTPEVLLAEDGDSNSSLIYRLEPINELVSIDNRMVSVTRIGHQFFEHKTPEGFFITKVPLDREMYSLTGFKLCADDSIHVACTNVVVEVIDVNDNPPRFKRDTHVIQIVENQVYLDSLIEFEIEDPDEQRGEAYKFMIIPDQSGAGTQEELEKYFTFRDDKMYLVRPVDRERVGTFHFYVAVTDSTHQIDPNSGKLVDSDETPGMTEVFIGIYDVNDNQPSFLFPNSSTVQGNRLNVSCHEIKGASVGSVRASDLDQGQNGTIIYSMTNLPPNSINNPEIFYLDNQTGLLYCNSNRLAEMCGTHYSFMVSADDLGDSEYKRGRQPTTERLIIFLQDQPTLAELQAVEAQFSADSNSREGGHRSAFSVSTKTILNIILGSSTLFFIGLLVIWILLLVYHKNKRRHLIINNSHHGFHGDGGLQEPFKTLQAQHNMDLYPFELETENGQSMESNSMLGTNVTNLPIYNQLKIIESPKMSSGLYTIHGPLNETYKTLKRGHQQRPASVNNDIPTCQSEQQFHQTATTLLRSFSNNPKKIADNSEGSNRLEHAGGPYHRVLMKNKNSGDDQYCTFGRISENAENVYRVLDNPNYLLRSPGKSVLLSKMAQNNRDQDKLTPSNDRRQFGTLSRQQRHSEEGGDPKDQHYLQSHDFQTNPEYPADFNFLQDVLNSCV